MVLKIQSVIEEKDTGYNPSFTYCESDVPIVISPVSKGIDTDGFYARECRPWISSARLAVGRKDGKQWHAVFDGPAWLLENGKTIDSFRDYALYGDTPEGYIIPVQF